MKVYIARNMGRAAVLLSSTAIAASLWIAGCTNRPRVDARGEKAAEALDESPIHPLKPTKELELVATVKGPMPTGIAVSKDNRIFLNFPNWGDEPRYTVGELVRNEIVPFPSAEYNSGTPEDFVHKFVSVQSVVVDEQNRLWVVDTGSVKFGPALPGAAKLVSFNLRTKAEEHYVTFPNDVVLPTSYLNDVRLDLRRGAAGYAYLTDSSDRGPNGIIVVDLASGKSWRRLHDHPSTKASPNFVPTVEGRELYVQMKPRAREYLRMGSDGLAVVPQQHMLYYCPLASRELYRIDLNVLSDPSASDDSIASAVQRLEERDFASDGLEAGSHGELYLTDYEHNALRVRADDGTYTVLASDRRLIWPDSLSLSRSGFLYVTANQLNRQPRFQEGRDKRRQPYAVFRVSAD